MIPDIQLTRELVDQIVFGMENQEHTFVLDIDTRTVVLEPAGGIKSDPDRYVELPPWRSVDGYNLMSRFVSSLGNPIYRERLRAILLSGRGVFRQFKDTVSERPEIERLWFAFRRQEMRSVVAEWLNDVREQRGLERLELPDEEGTEPLIASDFTIRDSDGEHAELIQRLDLQVFEDNHSGSDPDVVAILYRKRAAGLVPPSADASTVLIAETPGGDTVALLWAVRTDGETSVLSEVHQIYVYPEYRGVGLARALLAEHLRRCGEDGVSEVLVRMDGAATVLEEPLAEFGFGVESVSMMIDVNQFAREQST